MPSNIIVKQLRGLVAIVFGRLFIRSTHSVSFMPEGAAFLSVAPRFLDGWQGGFNKLRGLFDLQRGELSVAAMPSFASNCLPSVIAKFYRQHPSININAQDTVMENVIDVVKCGRLEQGTKFQSDSANELDFESLFNERFIDILPPKNPLMSAIKVAFTGLFRSAVIALNRFSGTRRGSN